MAKYEPTRSGKSMDEIAALMAQKTMEMRGQEARRELEDDALIGDNTNDQLTESETEARNVDPGDRGQTDESDIESQQDKDRSVSDDDESSDSDTSEDDDEVRDSESSDELEFELSDDTMIEVAEGKDISFKDLKAIYFADETITQRVAEHNELANEAQTVRSKAIEDANLIGSMMQAVYEQIDAVVAAPLISKPSAELKQTNPEQYIRHMDAYEQDQERIASSKTSLENAMNEFMKQQKETRDNRQAEAIRRLHREVPELTNPETKNQAAQDILDSGAYYEFSPEEIQNAGDHRLYKMAYDAAQYRKLKNGQTSEIEDIKNLATQETKRVRTLRSRGTSAQSRETAKARRVKSLRSNAAKSGSVDDVAALIAAKHS